MLHGLKYTIFNCIFFHNMYQIMSAQTKIYYFIWICNPYISLIVFLDKNENYTFLLSTKAYFIQYYH